MFKKLLVIGGLVVVVAWACGNNVCKEIGSYVRTGWKEFRSAAKKTLSIDFEIKRAEDLLANLDKTDDRLLSAQADQIQAMRTGERELDRMQTNLEDRKLELQALNENLKTWQTATHGGDLKKEQMKVDLERKFRTFKAAEAAYKAKGEAQTRHKERLEMIKEQREALKQQKLDLAARIEKLKNDVEVLKLAEARSHHAIKDEQLDDLNALKGLVDGLESRIEKQMIELELRKDQEPKAPAGGSKVAPTGGRSVMNEVDAYFGNESKAAAKK